MNITFDTEYFSQNERNILELILQQIENEKLPDMAKSFHCSAKGVDVEIGSNVSDLPIEFNEIVFNNDPGLDNDSKGIPWDARIHSSSKAKNADGTWRKIRNLDPLVYDLIMCELETLPKPKQPKPLLGQAISEQYEDPAEPAEPKQPEDDEWSSEQVKIDKMAFDLSVAQATQKHPVQPVMTFQQLIAAIGSTMATGGLTTDGVKGALESIGLSSIADLAKNEKAIPLLITALKDKGHVLQS